MKAVVLAVLATVVVATTRLDFGRCEMERCFSDGFLHDACAYFTFHAIDRIILREMNL